MRRVNIHTMLDIMPRAPKNNKLTITRGSSASISFDLESKVYTMDDIEQLYFIFKFKDTAKYYTLVDYFEPCKEGEVAVAGVDYFERICTVCAHTSQHHYSKVTVNVGDSVEDYYTAVTDGRTNLPDWQFDEHFVYDAGIGYSYLNFFLNANETADLEVTDEDNLLNLEVAVKLDTDSLPGINGQDSTIIEPQDSIIVVDSLFAQLGIITPSETISSIASEQTYCADNLWCKD